MFSRKRAKKEEMLDFFTDIQRHDKWDGEEKGLSSSVSKQQAL